MCGLVGGEGGIEYFRTWDTDHEIFSTQTHAEY